MDIITPEAIESVVWAGELITPETTWSVSSRQRPIVTLGNPEIWPASDLKRVIGREWIPPLPDANCWLVRFACTLHSPKSWFDRIAEARLALLLRPNNSPAAVNDTYAHSLFPDHLSMEDNIERCFRLSPELKLTEKMETRPGDFGVRVSCKKAFPVIQTFDVGTPFPSWLFKTHAAYPLEGCQFVYALLVAKPPAKGIRVYLTLTTMVETKFGPVRFALPNEARVKMQFEIA